MNMAQNRKAISSEDLFTDYSKNDELQARFASLAGAQQISSDMLFGNAPAQQPSFG